MAATPNETFHKNTQLGSPLQLSARTEPQSGPGNQSADPLAGVSCSCSNCNIGQRSGLDALLTGRRKSIDSNAAGQALGDEDVKFEKGDQAMARGEAIVR